ncbi:signal peptidase II [Pseudooceanicola sp.]|uniref:signal peptidase II n=1 Tax=Pseudooceanicola sp. TaxID=1914328 RepID=UPI002611ABA4|nr:signal peptidase II [Pseudooceanicola sp.]MDF1856676.1 signal peptidase II [Pseudooceanicola sp.]
MRVLFLTAFWTLLADQASKALVVHGLNLRDRGEIDVLPPLLNFRMAWNQGMNFGLLSDHGTLMKWLLIGIAIVISAGVFWWAYRERPRPAGMIAAGLLIGGALGNVIDRLVYGAVADFLNMSCCGFENPYAFNVADIAIFFGAVALILVPAEKKAG